MPNDTLVSKIILSDSVFHIKTITDNYSTSYLSKDSPIWNILFLIAGSLLTYYLATRQKRNETVTEAKKEFLNRRIEAHTKLLGILASGRISTGPAGQVDVNYFKVFKTGESMNQWFTELLRFVRENKPLLNKKIIWQSIAFNNIRKIIEFIRVKKNDNSDEFLRNFGILYFKDFVRIFDGLEESIQYFFETEISIKYKYPSLTKEDYEEIEKYLKSFTFITENISHDEYFGKF